MLERQLETLRSSGLLMEYQPVKVSGDRYQEIPVYRSDRSNLQRTWARIFFVDCDVLLSRVGDLTVKSCFDFQSELLGRAFFEENTSLRWNMYLYFVYKEACALKQIDRMGVESDTHYARKYVVPAENLPASFILTNYSLRSKTMPAPEDEWQNILGSVGLIDCLYDNRYSNFIHRYLNSTSNAPQFNLSVHNTVQADDSLRIQRLDTLSVQHYREAIFGEKMTLALKSVNIIEGENGTGKSSLVDAIEYAMTGSIKRFADNDGDPNSGFAKVTGTNLNGNPLSLPSEGDPDIKSREQAWYHIPKTARKSTIGKKFEQINRFSIESVFSLVYSQCRDKDSHLIDSITALCFDESLLLMEKNWTTYRERFDTEWNNLEKDIQEIVSEQANYESKKENLIRQTHERQVNLNSLYLALFGTEPQHEGYSRFEDFKLRFGREIATLEQVDHPISFSHLVQHTAQHDQNMQELLLSIENLNKLKRRQEQVQQEYQYLNKQASSFQEQNNRYTQLLAQIQDCRAQFTNGISEDTFEKALFEYTTTFEAFEKIRLEDNDFLTTNRSHPLISLSEIETQEQEKNSQIILLVKNLQECMERKNSLTATLTSIRRNMDALEKKQVDLVHIGEALIKSLQSSTCPLCGHPYSDANELLRCVDDFANSNYAPMKEQMALLQIEFDDNEKKIGQLEEEMNKAQNRVAFLQNMKRIYQACSEIISVESCTLLGDIALQLDVARENILKKINELQHFGQVYGQFVSIFEATGIAKAPLSVYETYCIEIKSKTLDEIRKVSSQKELLESQMMQIGKAILDLGDITESVDQCVQKNRSLHAMLNALSNMKAGGLMLTDDTDLLRTRDLLSQLDGAIAVTQQNKEIKEVTRKLSDLEEKEIIKSRMADRCQAAINALGQLKKLTEYSRIFVEENLQEISTIFKKIHLPPEFSDLYIHQGEIVISRPDSEQMVRINEMSLGQKTSLALAIMFQMHMMGKDTPRILLLDEPIANLDDIHIMNLIDILRELTINGAQLFITTSNKEVAKFFARKFAFLVDDVAYYKLQRRITNGKVGFTNIETRELQDKIFY